MVKIHYFGTKVVDVSCDVVVKAVSIHGKRLTKNTNMSKRMLLDEDFNEYSEMFTLLEEDFEQRARDEYFGEKSGVYAILGVELVNYYIDAGDLIDFT